MHFVFCFEEKIYLACIDFKVLYNPVIVTEKKCMIYLTIMWIWTRSTEHIVNAFISINGLIDYLIHLEELSCIQYTNYTLYLLFSNYCTFIVSVIMTCILMLSGRKKKNRTIVTEVFCCFDPLLFYLSASVAHLLKSLKTANV